MYVRGKVDVRLVAVATAAPTATTPAAAPASAAAAFHGPLGHVRHQGDLARALDRRRDAVLMAPAGPRLAGLPDAAAVIHVLAPQADVLVVDDNLDASDAELAVLAPPSAHAAAAVVAVASISIPIIVSPVTRSGHLTITFSLVCMD
jgi:hypothetical protein